MVADRDTAVNSPIRAMRVQASLADMITSCIFTRDSPAVFMPGVVQSLTRPIKPESVLSTAPETAETSERPPNGPEGRLSGHLARLRGAPVLPSTEAADNLTRPSIMPTPSRAAARAGR